MALKHRQSAMPDVLAHVDNIPLLSLNALAPDLPPAVEVYGKADWFNPEFGEGPGSAGNAW